MLLTLILLLLPIFIVAINYAWSILIFALSKKFHFHTGHVAFLSISDLQWQAQQEPHPFSISRVKIQHLFLSFERKTFFSFFFHIHLEGIDILSEATAQSYKTAHLNQSPVHKSSSTLPASPLLVLLKSRWLSRVITRLSYYVKVSMNNLTISQSIQNVHLLDFSISSGSFGMQSIEEDPVLFFLFQEISCCLTDLSSIKPQAVARAHLDKTELTVEWVNIDNEPPTLSTVLWLGKLNILMFCFSKNTSSQSLVEYGKHNIVILFGKLERILEKYVKSSLILPLLELRILQIFVKYQLDEITSIGLDIHRVSFTLGNNAVQSSTTLRIATIAISCKMGDIHQEILTLDGPSLNVKISFSDSETDITVQIALLYGCLNINLEELGEILDILVCSSKVVPHSPSALASTTSDFLESQRPAFLSFIQHRNFKFTFTLIHLSIPIGMKASPNILKATIKKLSFSFFLGQLKEPKSDNLDFQWSAKMKSFSINTLRQLSKNLIDILSLEVIMNWRAPILQLVDSFIASTTTSLSTNTTCKSKIESLSVFAECFSSELESIRLIQEWWQKAVASNLGNQNQPFRGKAPPFGISFLNEYNLLFSLATMRLFLGFSVDADEEACLSVVTSDTYLDFSKSQQTSQLRLVHDIKLLTAFMKVDVSPKWNSESKTQEIDSEICTINMLNLHHRKMYLDSCPSSNIASASKEMIVSYSLQKHHLFYSISKKLNSIIKSNKSEALKSQEGSVGLWKVAMKSTFENVTLNMTLLSGSEIRFDLDNSLVSVKSDVLHCTSENGKIFCSLNGEQDMVKLMDILKLSFRRDLTSSLQQQPLSFYNRLQMQELQIGIPYDYSLSVIHQDFSDMFKIVKNIHGKTSTGEDIHTNPFGIVVGKILFTIEENKFEQLLSRILFLGHLEQLQRLERLQSFSKKVFQEAIPSEEVDIAYNLLMQHNSKEWVKRINEYDTCSSFMTLEILNYALELTSPIGVASSLTKEIRRLDTTTPDKLEYCTLIGRNISVKMGGILMQFRDYSTPLLYLPKREDEAGYVVNGLVIVSEVKANQQGGMDITKSIDIGAKNPVVITVSSSPVKLYVDLIGRLNNIKPLLISYGPCYAGAFYQFSRAVSKYTKPSIDPSDPLGWWDKIRLMIHGKLVIHGNEGCEVRFRILGSRDPYFEDGIRGGGNAGLNLNFRGQFECGIGNCDKVHVDEIKSDWKITVRCHESIWFIPFPFLTKDFGNDYLIPERRQLHFREIMSGQVEKSQIIFHLSKGVVYSISFDFVTSSAEILPVVKRALSQGLIRRHSDIFLNPKPTIQSAKKLDSYAGFRSKKIKIVVGITTGARDELPGLPITGVHLTPEHWNHMEIVIAVLTMPPTLGTRPCKVFYTGNKASTVKFTRLFTEYLFKFNFSHCIINYMNHNIPAPDLDETNSYTSGVGVRCKASTLEMNVKVARITASKLVKPSTSKRRSTFSSSDKDLKKPGTWSIVYALVDSSDIEGSAVAIYSTASVEQVNEEVNEESESFLWIPRVTYTNHSGMDINEESFNTILSNQDPNHIQLDLMEQRQQTLEDKLVKMKDLDIEEIDIKPSLDLLRKRVKTIDQKITSLSKQLVGNIFKDNKRTYISDQRPEVLYSGWHEALRMFNRYFVAHNALVLWTQGTRNIIFKLIEFEKRSNALRFYLSPASLKVVKDVLGKRDNEMRVSPNPIQIFDKFMADALLEKLIQEESVSFIVTDDETKYNQNTDVKNKGTKPVTEDTSNIVNNYCIRFINPQINLGSSWEDIGDAGVLLIAERMDLKCLSHIEKQNNELIKHKRIATIEDAQIFTYMGKRVRNAFPNIQLRQLLDLDQWPLWLPLENILDRKVNSDVFEEVVHQAMITIYNKVYNPLYSPTEPVQDDFTTSHITREESQKNDVLKFSSPKIVLSANSNQFNLIYHIVVDLLIYKEPAQKERVDRLKALLLAIELYDIRDAMNTVSFLQNTIRNLEITCKSQTLAGHFQFDDSIQESEAKLQTAKDELLFLMEALTVYGAKTKRSPYLKTRKTIFASDEVIWTLILDDEMPLCLFMLQNSIFTQTMDRDQSIVNILEVDHILVKNVWNPSLFPDLVAPYNPDNKTINYSRNKMIRVYWSEVPPVGGIPIVDHFEVNISPLRFQIEYETGRQLIHYVFPQKKQSAGGAISNVPSTSISKAPEKSHLEEEVSSEYSISADRKSHLEDFSLVFVEANADLRMMKNRASEYRTYIYIKIPGVVHCFSYKAKQQSSFLDLNNFVFFLPTQEYRNKTWRSLEFLNQIKNDIRKFLLGQSASLVKEKIFKRTQKSTFEELSKTKATLARYIVGKHDIEQKMTSGSDASEVDDEDMDEPPSGPGPSTTAAEDSHFKGIKKFFKKKNKLTPEQEGGSAGSGTARSIHSETTPDDTSNQIQRAKLLLGKLYI